MQNNDRFCKRGNCMRHNRNKLLICITALSILTGCGRDPLLSAEDHAAEVPVHHVQMPAASQVDDHMAEDPVRSSKRPADPNETSAASESNPALDGASGDDAKRQDYPADYQNISLEADILDDDAAQEWIPDAPAPAVTAKRTPHTTSANGSQTTAASQTTARMTTKTGTHTTARNTTNMTEKTTESRTTALNIVTEPVLPPVALSSPEERLAAMTLEEKAAQMMMSSASDAQAALNAASRNVGAICLFAGAFRGKSAAQVQQMTEELQSKSKTPILLCVDEEGGTVNRVSLNPQLRSVPFRTGRALFDEGGWDLVAADTQEKANLLLSLGIQVNLAPVCDVPLSSTNYISNRTFSLDPNETSDYISLVVTEMKNAGLGSVLKHFPGYGGSIDTHQYMAYDERDYSAFTDGDFLPFAAGIEAGADAVMVSHNIVQCMDPDYPASLSPEVHRILREDLGFSGVIMTDDLGMNAITLFTGGRNPAVAAVMAGNDIVTYANDSGSAAAICEAVRSGAISEEQINESVLRILYWKQSLGMID